jgi:hypothetical protein
MNSIPSQPADETADPFVLYSRSLYEYTFLLWKESKKVADENTHAKAAETGKEKTRKDDNVHSVTKQPRSR